MKKKLIAVAIAAAVFAPLTAQAMFDKMPCAGHMPDNGCVKMAKPTNHYDELAWKAYWAENPTHHRGVGAEGDNPPTAEEFAELQTQLNAATESLTTATTSIATLTEDNEKWKGKQKEADKHQKEAEKSAKDALDEANRKSGNVEALEASWNEKYGTLQTESASTIQSLNGIINNVTVGAEARSMASDIALPGSAAVLEPHIKSRLDMELVDGKPVIKVLDINGNASALTLDDLRTEISENKAFAPIVKGSDANGNGEPGNGGKGGDKAIKRSVWDTMNAAQRSKHMKEGGSVID